MQPGFGDMQVPGRSLEIAMAEHELTYLGAVLPNSRFPGNEKRCATHMTVWEATCHDEGLT